MKSQNSKLKILVTGVGSELAFSIIKALRISTLNYKLIGTDIYPEVAGKYWADSFYKVSKASEGEKYIDELKRIVKIEGINVIIPTVDSELKMLSENKLIFLKELNCHILINELSEIKRFSDKWLSYEWFINNNIPTPKSILLQNEESLKDDSFSKFPLIIKPRIGGGSRSIFKIDSKSDLSKYISIVPEPVLQEYLYPDNEEFTAGSYRTLDGEIHSLVLKRTLKFGMTNTAEVIVSDELTHFVKDVVSKTRLIGSNNIQFRVTEEGPKVLEINPRFSGTTGIRANFGFNDLEMWIKQLMFKSTIGVPSIKKGFVLRFMEEQYHFIS